MKKLSCSEQMLFNELPSDMTEVQYQLLFEQYKLYLQTVDNISERRHQTNAFFLTLNTVLVTATTGFVSTLHQSLSSNWWIAVASIGGVLLCVTWYRLIESYQKLNRGKFTIIYLLESYLPANIFRTEWETLGQGKSSDFIPFNKMERWIPLIFASLYIFIIFFITWQLLEF